VEEVEEEIQRLRDSWQRPGETSATSGESIDLSEILAPDQVGQLDPFDHVQLAYVAAVCQRSKSISEAGREIFAVSRAKRSVTNDADRLKKYLAKFGLGFDSFRSSGS
jgi:transcriptional regulatory protein RtcR